jgi:DNA-binding transcriptional LysR family regulator
MTTIDLNRVATFVRVARTGSFTAAAKELGLPVSSVSRSVAGLEQELGVRLLHRTTRRLSLTDGGQHFFRRMSTVLGEAEEAARAVMGFAVEARGVVRITAPPDLGGQQQLPRILKRIREAHPGLSFELLLSTRVLDMVADGIDLAVRAGVLPDSSLMVRKVRESTLALFAAPDYLERRGRPRSLDDLLQHDCLCYGGRDGRLPWRLTGPGGTRTLQVKGVIVCDDMIFLRDAASVGMGITLVPVDIVTSALEEGRLVRVLPRYGRDGGAVYVVWPSQKLVPAAVVTARELLIAELEQIYR